MLNICFSEYLYENLMVASDIALEKRQEKNDLRDNLYKLQMEAEIGDISEIPFGEKRKQDFANRYGTKERAYREQRFNNVSKKISEIELKAKQGEKIRIWYSEQSSEMCAFCYFLCLLDMWEIENKNIFFIKLPGYILFENGEYEKHPSTGSYEPELLIKSLKLQQQLSFSYKSFHINQWKRAQCENTGMRTVLSGEIISVYEDFYDQIILTEIEKSADIIKETDLLAPSLTKTNTNVKFIISRIDNLIRDGILEVVEEQRDVPYFSRTFKKKTM